MVNGQVISMPDKWEYPWYAAWDLAFHTIPLMMVDPDVHYHVIPRYPGSRSFKGLEYRDTGWPGPPALEPAIALDDAARDALVAALRQGWQQAEAQAK